ncbi:uncharacterized protein DNG_01174 [Cephalotrichum gorgonifer]|uniref:Mitochondrial division protein 1 n=1 Tax=Cephalotrichum gorgonifer TaxID=2041049 RepID=A0AAE8MSL5_9PEZI|nr:uncharacterized protein DNG_01174 [Cephalotrichum gorgonifer]
MEANWNYCLQTLEGHDDSVRSVIISPDGKQLASGSDDTTIRVWDASSGTCLQILKGHDGWVNSVVFSSDGKQLISSSYDTTIRIWDVSSGRCLQTLGGHEGYVTSVIFSADGKQLISSSADRTVRIWDASLGICLQVLPGHDSRITSVVFSPDSKQLASSSLDKTIKIWDAGFGTCLQTLKGHDDYVNSVVFSADGKQLISGSSDMTIKIWDVSSGTCLQTLEGHDDSVRSVIISPDGKQLASGSDDTTIKIWDVSLGLCLQTLKGHDAFVNSVVFSADSKQLISGSSDMVIRIWDASLSFQTIEGHDSWIRYLTFLADGKQLLSDSDDMTFKIWDASSGACLRTLEGHDGSISKVSFDDSGGVIGCTTAYFLTRHSSYNPALHTITLLEATSIAAGASGKAGGLLALWAYPDGLVQLSFRLHAELAAQHGGEARWGYRRLKCGSLGAKVSRAKLDSFSRGQALGEGGGGSGKEWEKLPKQDGRAAELLEEARVPPDLDWIDPETVAGYAEMGGPGTTDTAQVHPFQFTNAIAELAREAGVDIKIGARLTEIRTAGDKGPVEGVEYIDRETGQSRTIDSVTDVVVCAGPWTGKILPRSRVEGLRAHSVVFEADVSPYAIFTDISLPPDYVPPHRAEKGQKRRHRGSVDPEMYARPNREVYACGEPDNSVPLPETADLVQVDDTQCDDLISYISTISPPLRAAPIKARQSCYLPRHMRFGQERGPIAGPTSVSGVWVASGHTCWGIQNGPGTGYLMAEWLFEGASGSPGSEKLDPRLFKV